MLIIFLVSLLIFYVNFSHKEIEKTEEYFVSLHGLVNLSQNDKFYSNQNRNINLIKLELLFTQILEIFKSQNSNVFKPPIQKDPRYEINQYRDQLSKDELFQELLIQIIYLNSTAPLNK